MAMITLYRIRLHPQIRLKIRQTQTIKLTLTITQISIQKIKQTLITKPIQTQTTILT